MLVIDENGDSLSMRRLSTITGSPSRREIKGRLMCKPRPACVLWAWK
jgi:hypothetical protein